jgi:hypothetical protein
MRPLKKRGIMATPIELPIKILTPQYYDTRIFSYWEDGELSADDVRALGGTIYRGLILNPVYPNSELTFQFARIEQPAAEETILYNCLPIDITQVMSAPTLYSGDSGDDRIYAKRYISLGAIKAKGYGLVVIQDDFSHSVYHKPPSGDDGAYNFVGSNGGKTFTWTKAAAKSDAQEDSILAAGDTVTVTSLKGLINIIEPQDYDPIIFEKTELTAANTARIYGLCGREFKCIASDKTFGNERFFTAKYVTVKFNGGYGMDVKDPCSAGTAGNEALVTDAPASVPASAATVIGMFTQNADNKTYGMLVKKCIGGTIRWQKQGGAQNQHKTYTATRANNAITYSFA